MAQTTSQINACNAVIEIDNDSGTPVNVSGSTNKANFSLGREIGKAATFEGDYMVKNGCKIDGTIDISALFTTNSAEARQLLEDWWELKGKRTISIYPNGKTVGERHYQCEAILANYDFPIDAGSADPIMIDVTAEIDGKMHFLFVGS